MGKFTPLDFNKYAALARQAAAEGCVLLKNENEALPLRKGDKVAVFGRIAFHYYKSGLGSGGLVNTKYVVGILDALKEEKDITLDENLLGTYEKWIEKNPYDEGQGWGKVPWSQKEMELTDEIVGVVNLITSVYDKFGFTYHLELSTRPDDSMGSDEDWEAAEAGLKTALEQLGMDYVINEGDGAFYGPKIDFHLEDSLGRTWQCGTVQLDFQMPQNFDLTYIDADGEKKRPIMLHRVCFGSIERFIGILIEHFEGKFPTWLAPLQVKVLPVSEKSRDYAHTVCDQLVAAGVRAKVDDRDEKIGYKIRDARSTDRVPYMLIIGEKEVESGNISVRDRSNETVQRELSDFIADIKAEIAERR